MIIRDAKPGSAEDVRKSYDAIAERFSQTRGYVWKECEEFAKTLSKGSLVLDLACGNGRNARMLVEKGFDVISGDVSIELLKDAPKPRILLDARNLPFKDESFDSAVFIAAIHHLDESGRAKALTELRRVLVSGARTLVSAWSASAERFSEHIAKGGSRDIEVLWENKVPRYYHLFVEDELTKLAEDVGFRIEKEFETSENRYVVLVK